MQFYISDILIPLDPGVSLPLVKRSPLFINEDGKISGSYIFNITVPAGEAIRQVYTQAHRPQRNGKATAELPYLLLDGVLRYKGNCIVKEANKDNYQVSLKVDYPELGEKTLKGLDLGGDRSITSDPMASATSANNYAYEDWQNGGPFNYTENLPLSGIIMDEENCFNIAASTYTARADGNRKLIGAFDVGITYGSVYFRVYKGGSLLIDIELVNGLNPVSEELDLVTGDILAFKIYAASWTVFDQEVIYFSIAANYFVEMSGTPVFNEVVTGDQTTCDYAVFPIHNETFLSNFPEDRFQLDNLSIKTIYSNYFKVLNYWKDGRFPISLVGTVEGETIVCSNLFTPMVYMRKLLEQVITEAGYTCVNNPFDTEDFFGAVLYNAYAENNYISEVTTLMPIKPTFNLVDHVPAMLQSEFLREASKLTGFMPVPDNDTMTITFVNLKDKPVISRTNPAVPFPGVMLANPTVRVDPEYKGIKFELKKATSDKYLEHIKELSSKFIDKGTLANPGQLPLSGNKVNDMYYVESDNTYYVFQYDTETYQLYWVPFGVKHPLVYTEGDAPFLEVIVEFSPVLTKYMLDTIPGAPDSRYWTIPITEQPGILEGFPDSLSAETGLQVLYYKGMVNDSLGQAYPLGSARCADYTGMTFPDISATGLINNRYKNWLEWLVYNAKPVTYNAIMTRAQLKALKYEQVYSGNNVNFLVKELRVNMKKSGLSVGELDLYTF